MSRVFEFLRVFHGALKIRALKIRALKVRSLKTEPIVGVESILDGRAAVATLEASLAEACCTGGSQQVEAGLRIWYDEQLVAVEGARPLTVVRTEGPRGAFAASRGLALSGSRAVVFLGADDIQTVSDQIRLATIEHLPLVIYVLGHPELDALTGSVQLFAANVQEAVDLGLVARYTAERALLPVFVILDEHSVAASVQDVSLPTPEQALSLLGSPSDTIDLTSGDCCSKAQAILFGSNRRRVPARFDLERPMLSGTRGQELDRLGALSQRAFMNEDLEFFLSGAREQLQKICGRRINPVSTFKMEGAKTVFVTAGAVTETAELVAEQAADGSGLGVVGLRQLSPFPTSVLESLRGRGQIIVLESRDRGTDDAALTTILRAEMARAIENGRFGTADDGVVWSGSDMPQLRTAFYRDGSLDARDLAVLPSSSQRTVRLGLESVAVATSLPKRQALLDRLARDFPGASALGLSHATRAGVLTLGRSRACALTIGVQRGGGALSAELAAVAVELIGKVYGGRVRSSLSHGDLHTFTIGASDLRHAGDAAAVDVLVVCGSARLKSEVVGERLTSGGRVLVAHCGEDRAVGQGLDSDASRLLVERGIKLYTAPSAADPAERLDELLGALVALVDSEAVEVPVRKVQAERESSLEHLDLASRASLVAAFERGSDALRAIDLSSLDASTVATTPRAAKIAESTSKITDGLDSLTRFWGETGVVSVTSGAYLSPEPRFALPSLPPLSAAFRDFSSARGVLPVFDPSSCTACGDCWTACPDAAIAPVALDWKAILEAGFATAKKAGAAVDALRPAISKVAARANKVMRADDAPSDAGPILRAAFEQLIDKLASTEDRRQALELAFAAVTAEVEILQVARTAACFDAAEEVFSLVVDPNTCKACGACVEVCAEDALSIEPQTPELLESARAMHQLWERLPDTAGTTIARLADNPDVGRAAAVLLSRHCLLAMSGGSSAEAGSGEQLALRHALAATEVHLQPALQRQLIEVEKLIRETTDKIREILVAALPSDDIVAFDAALAGTKDRHVDLAEFLAHADPYGDGRPVDRAHVERIHSVRSRLHELRDRIAEGASGFGRARSSVAIADGAVADWAAAYPYNPFPMPVAIDDSGEAAQLARGLLEGQLRAVVEDFRVLRLAKIELERPKEAPIAEERLKSLSFDDLLPEEQMLCPPLLLVGSDKVLGGRCLAQVTELLASKLPISILSLCDLDLGLDQSGGPSANSGGQLAMIALLQRSAYVAQSSVGDADHLMDSLLGALNFRGPSLVHVHAPSPSRHGFTAASTLARAEAAIHSRTHPLFRFDPERAGVFGSCLELSGNPGSEVDWVTNESGAALTCADWALGEQRFAAFLQPLADGAPSPIALVDFLDLDPMHRAGKTAFIVPSPGERLQVDTKLVEATRTHLRTWQTLRELAGIVTPFTDQVRATVAEELQIERDAELTALRADYEAKLALVKADTQSELAARLHSRLVTLATQGAAKLASTNGGQA